jgi:hypothetical protein
VATPNWYDKTKIDSLLASVYQYVDNKGGYTDEQARDAVAAMIAAGSQNGISFSYDDVNDTLSATVTAGSGGTVQAYTDEQVRDVVAAMIAAGTQSGINFVYNDANDSLSATVTAATGGGSTDAATPYGSVWLDSFAGSDDDTKLGNALAAVSADTYPRTIRLAARQHTFATQRTAFDGLRIMGPEGYSNPERGGAAKSAMRITLGMTGAWITSNGTNYQVSLHNLAFSGGSQANVLSGTYYCLSMRDIFSSGLKSVLGTQSSKLLITAANFTGDWEINNCYNGAFHIGGSDSTLWTDGMLLDSGTAFNSSGNANGQYHLWCDGMDKSYIGPLYVTCEGGWGGVRFSGPAIDTVTTNQGVMIMNGAKVEGRNPGQPCNGANVRVDGGNVTLRDCWISYGMANTSSFGAGDVGVINHTAGTLTVDGCQYDRATGVATSTPYVYTSSNGDVIVSAIKRASRGGSWGTARPVVAKPTANTDTRILDATVTAANV